MNKSEIFIRDTQEECVIIFYVENLKFFEILMGTLQN